MAIHTIKLSLDTSGNSLLSSTSHVNLLLLSDSFESQAPQITRLDLSGDYFKAQLCANNPNARMVI